MVLAEVESPQGRRVTLTERRLRYLENHPEMIGHVELLLEAIRAPDLQEADPRPGRERYWSRTSPPFPPRWLRVVTESRGDHDVVITAFGQNNDPRAAP